MLEWVTVLARTGNEPSPRKDLLRENWERFLLEAKEDGREFELSFLFRTLLKTGCSKSFMVLHELTYQSRNFIRCRIEREMTTIDNMDFSIGHISPVGFRLRGVKR
jgi:hypothetical protein